MIPNQTNPNARTNDGPHRGTPSRELLHCLSRIPPSVTSPETAASMSDVARKIRADADAVGDTAGDAASVVAPRATD
jgi:hypothetical protein